jgi:uncharacterized membrane protein YhaH (DUF805 family)
MADQDLYIEDLFRTGGTINRANFRVLLLLWFGLKSVLYFLPGLVVALLSGNRGGSPMVTPEEIQENFYWITPFIWIPGGLVLIFLLLNSSRKRWRDSGLPAWKMMIPFWNIWLLLTIPAPDNKSNTDDNFSG